MRPIRASLLFAGIAGTILGSLHPRPAFGQAPPKLERCQNVPQEDGVYRLATGPMGGSYVKFGQVLSKLAPSDMKIVPCLTDGTLENIDVLTRDQAEFAIAQQDVLHIGWSKEPSPEYAEGKAKVKWPDRFDDIKLVRWLYSERLQIIAGPHSYVTSLADVTKEHFWVGPEGGGTYATAVEVLRAAGMSLDEIKQKAVTGGDFDTANDDLYSRKVPVIFRTTPVPMHYSQDLQTPCKTRHAGGKLSGSIAIPAHDDDRPNLTCLFKLEPEIQLVGLDNAILKRLKQNPSYVVTPIYRNTYPNQNDGILTIGIGAALIARDTVSEKAVTELFALFDSSATVNKIQDEMNVRLDLVNKKLDRTLDDDEAMLIDGVHPAVRDQLTLSFVDRHTLAGELALFLLLLLCLALWHRGFRRIMGSNAKYVVTAAMILTACGIFGLILWLVEGPFTSGFENPLIAAWSLIVYFAQGLKTETLVTSQGQFTALLALAVIATLVHTLNSDALDQLTNRFASALQRFFQNEEKENSKQANLAPPPAPVNGETLSTAKDFPANPAAKPVH